MVAKSPVEAELDRALLVDEIGIASAVIGPHRLKTTHQPMFRRDGAVLVPFGVEARITAERDGAGETAAAFFDQVPLPQRRFAEALCRKLNLNNFHYVGIDDPYRFDYYLTIDPRLEASEVAMAEIAAVPRLLDALEMPATSLIVEILDANFISLDVLLGLAGRLRDAGVRIAVAEFRTGQPTVDRLTLLRPDVIKIDGDWFRSAQDSAATARLLPAVLNAFTGLGARLLVQGIETIVELDAALGCETDYLQGRALAGPAPAGSIIDPDPRDLDELLQAAAQGRLAAPQAFEKLIGQQQQIVGSAECRAPRVLPRRNHDHHLWHDRQRQLLQAAPASGQARPAFSPCRGKLARRLYP